MKLFVSMAQYEKIAALEESAWPEGLRPILGDRKLDALLSWLKTQTGRTSDITFVIPLDEGSA